MKVLKTILSLIFILAAILFVAVPLTWSDLNIYIDEGVHHIARSLAIKDLGFFAKIVPNFANGFGYSWALFEGKLTYEILKYILIDGSITLEYKAFEFGLMIASFLTMFWLVNVISKNKVMSVLAGALYVMLPYHLTTMYIENSVVEQMTFVLIPLVFVGTQYLINNSKLHLIYPLACSLLFLTSVSIGYIIMAISVLYILINYDKLWEKKIRYRLFVDVFLVFFITAFDWGSRIQTMVSCNYKINNITDEEFNAFANSSISLRKLFVTAKNEKYVFEVGPIFIAMFAVMPMAITTIRKKYLKNYLFFLLMCILFLILSTNIFPWGEMPHFVARLSSPHKLLSIGTFFLVLVCTLNVGAVIDNLQFKHVAILVVLNAISIALLAGYIQKADISNYKINAGVITGKQDEVQAGLNKLEYLPTKVFDNKFYIATRSQDLIVTSGKALVENYGKKDGVFTAKVTTYEEKAYCELPYIYYPGYKVTGDGIEIAAFENENGFLGIVLPSNDTVNIEVRYGNSSGIVMMNVASIFSCILFLGYTIYELVRNNKEKQFTENS